MSIIYRPWANDATDLTGAVIVEEATLPQTITGLSAGRYEIGRIAWDATEHVVESGAAFNYTLVNTAGAEIATTAFVKNLRISLNGSENWCQIGAGDAANLVLTCDGQSLEISGFASEAERNSARIYFEQPEDVNRDLNGLEGLFARNPDNPTPLNPTMPGALQIAATRRDTPIGVA